MTNYKRLLWLLVLGIPAFGSLATLGSNPGTAEETRGASADQLAAVRGLRAINTAQLRYRQGKGTYATWEELRGSHILDDLDAEVKARGDKRPPALLLDKPQPIPGFELSVYTSSDGSRYLVSLKDFTPSPCRPSFFTDETGIIRQATAIGCSGG